MSSSRRAARALLDSRARHMTQNLVLSSSTARRLAQRGHVTGRAGRPEGAADILVQLLAVGARAGAPVLEGRVVAELGPGQTANVLLGALALGAERAVALDVTTEPVDAWTVERFRQVAAALADRAADLPPGTKLHLDRYDGVAVVPSSDRTWVAYDGQTIPLPAATIDVVVSYSVLEHVREPGRVLAEVRRLLTPTGGTWHAIDLRDHYRLGPGEDWLSMLRHSNRAWELMTSNRSNWVNRLRATQWRTLFAAAGFHVTDAPVSEPFGAGFDRDRLAPAFRMLSTDELSYSWYEVAASPAA